MGNPKPSTGIRPPSMEMREASTGRSVTFNGKSTTFNGKTGTFNGKPGQYRQNQGNCIIWAWFGSSGPMGLFIGQISLRVGIPEPNVREVWRPVTQPKSASKPVASGNNESTQKLLDYVRQNGQAKTGALVEALGIPKRTMIRTLNKLIVEGRLVREGNGQGAVYKINDSGKAE
jgi:hypothetical protein